jgi:hypothetical protein
VEGLLGVGTFVFDILVGVEAAIYGVDGGLE